MSQSLVDQITLDCLLNKTAMGKHVMKQREKQIDKEDFKFYRKRIFNLFKDVINNAGPNDLSPDVKYAYDTFIKSTIHYFKVLDNNDLIQEDYKDIVNEFDDTNNDIDSSCNFIETDKLMMRSVKMDIPTLDKYVKRKVTKKNKEIILPKQKEINLLDPQFQTKGLK